MKRTITFAAFAVAAFATGFAGTSLVQTHAVKTVKVALDGDPCITELGISGYMVSTGLVETCKANGAS